MKLDPQLIFYLKHQKQIETWQGLRSRVKADKNSFYESLHDPIKEMTSALDGVEFSAQLDRTWPRYFLYRSHWKGDTPDIIPIAVCLMWERSRAGFDDVWIGIRIEDDARVPASKLKTEICKTCPKEELLKVGASTKWPVYRKHGPEQAEYWDHLDGYAGQLVGTLKKRWFSWEGHIETVLKNINASDDKKAE
jgi:hypothetical protein